MSNTVFWIIMGGLIAGPWGFTVLISRRQNAANAPGWASLTPLIQGRVRGNGVEGAFRGRPVAAGLKKNTGDRYEPLIHWRCELTMGAGAPPPGRGGGNWEVDCRGAEPRLVRGDEEGWRQVLAFAGSDRPGGLEPGYLRFDARRGRLHAFTNLDVGFSFTADLKDMARVPEPPSPERFQARLDSLFRLSEAIQGVDVRAREAAAGASSSSGLTAPSEPAEPGGVAPTLADDLPGGTHATPRPPVVIPPEPAVSTFQPAERPGPRWHERLFRFSVVYLLLFVVGSRAVPGLARIIGLDRLAGVLWAVAAQTCLYAMLASALYALNYGTWRYLQTTWVRWLVFGSEILTLIFVVLVLVSL